jgi:hypothetical protein
MALPAGTWLQVSFVLAQDRLIATSGFYRVPLWFEPNTQLYLLSKQISIQSSQSHPSKGTTRDINDADFFYTALH